MFNKAFVFRLHDIVLKNNLHKPRNFLIQLSLFMENQCLSMKKELGLPTSSCIVTVFYIKYNIFSNLRFNVPLCFLVLEACAYYSFGK